VNYITISCVDFVPPAGTSVWSMMGDELLVASLVDPSIITKSGTRYLDAEISPGPSYGHTVVWKKPEDLPQFFFHIAGRVGRIIPNGRGI
jgi:inosine-uridine nucleoside N-ribohydrolase